jgi:hypothetical protein
VRKNALQRYLEMPVFNFVVVVLMVVVASIAIQKGCSTEDPEVVVQKTPPPEPVLCSGDKQPGESRFLSCAPGQTGRILETCTASGSWVEADRSCTAIPDQCAEDAAGKVTFVDDVRPIMEQSCAGSSCHNGYNQYPVVASVMQPPNYELLNRIQRDDQRRMPKPPAAPLSPQDKNTLQQWLNDGLINEAECADSDGEGNAFVFVDEDYIEEKIEADLTRLDNRSRENSTYVVFAHQYNQRVPKEVYDLHVQGMLKSLNSLSRNENLAQATPIDVRETVWRVNLEDFDLDSDVRFGRKFLANGQVADNDFWDLVIRAEPFQLESFTTRGLNIKALSGRRVTWLHADNFTFTSHENDQLYYAALGVPTTLDAFFDAIGVDFQECFDDFEVVMAGGFGSPISLNKNRMILRCRTERSALAREGGYMWYTQDPIALDGVAERNLFQFPFPKEANSALVFDFAAGEIIWTMPNGMQGYVLFDSNGIRQAEAPVFIVTDTDSPFSPVIENSISCHRCHAKGIIPMGDEVRNSVLANATEFDRDDVERVKAFYPPASALNDVFRQDRDQFKRTMDQLGVSTLGADPLNFTTDAHRKDWTLEEFCSFILIDLNQCQQLLRESAAVKAQIGQLLTGGTVSRDQIIQAFPQVIADFRLGLDDFDQ